MAKPIITAIDVGTHKVCALIAEVHDNNELEVLGVGIEPSRGMQKGAISNVDEASTAVANAVEQAERSSGLEIGAAFVSLAGAHVGATNSRGVVGIGGSRAIEQADIDRALEGAQAITVPHNREVLHIIPRSFIVDGQDGIRSPLGMHGFRLEVEAHIISVSKTVLQNVTKCVENAGVAVEQVVINPLASAEVALTETEREMGVLVCDIGAGTMDIAIYIEGNVWHTAVLPVGGKLITADIAHGLRLPFEVAEAVKLEHGHALASEVTRGSNFKVQPFGLVESAQSVSQLELAQIVQPRVEEIFELALQEIKRSGYDGMLSAGVVLTGGTARLPGIRQLASSVMQLPVRLVEPPQLRGLVDRISGPEFSTTVGLLHWAARTVALQPHKVEGGFFHWPQGVFASAFGWVRNNLLP